MNILQIDMNEPMCQRVSVVRYNSACRLIFGAIDYICIAARVALQEQKEDNSYMSRLRDTFNLSS